MNLVQTDATGTMPHAHTAIAVPHYVDVREEVGAEGPGAWVQAAVRIGLRLAVALPCCRMHS